MDKGVDGNTRSTLLKSYLNVYGPKKCPRNVHEAVRWGSAGQEDMRINYDDDPDFVWKRVEKEGKAKDGKIDDGKAKDGKHKATNDKGKWPPDKSANEMRQSWTMSTRWT